MRAGYFGYVVAVLTTGLVVLVRGYLLRDLLGDEGPLLLFIVPVLLAAFAGGFWPGLFATFFSTIAGTYFIISQQGLHAIEPFDWLRIVLLLIFGALTSWLIESLVTTRRRLQASLVEELSKQKRLEALTQQVRTVTESMQAQVTRCSRDMRYLWVSKPYADWIDMPVEAIVGRPIVEVIGVEAFERLQPYFLRVFAGEKVQYEDTVPFDSTGPRWINAIYAPTFGDDGKPDGWVAVVTDISDRKRTEETLRDADRRKDEFLATLAHELRNPLAPIRTSLELLKIGVNKQEAEEAQAVMERQIGHMVHLIDDLLDVSRITMGKFELRKERTDLGAIIQSAIETSRPLIESKQHRLTVELPNEPVFLDADPIRLAQVFSNLLNNSAKYTERGGSILLNVEQQGSDVVATVKDNGIGIPDNVLPRVFDMFTQVDRSLERSQGGLGIGLTLAKRVVEMHGGSIEAHSDGPNRGAEFRIRLPVVIAPATSQPLTADDEFNYVKRPCCRILVADDNEDAARSLGQMLRLLGNEVHIVHDGVQAVEITKTFQPELIFLDLGMPNLNGYDAARRIRGLPLGKGIRLVAVTGWGQEDDLRRSQEAGFDLHLVKPVSITDVRRALGGSIQTAGQ